MSKMIPPMPEERPRKPWFSNSGCCTIILLLAVSFVLLVNAMRDERESARRMQCGPKSLACQFLAYHEIYGSFPPAYTVDATGKPLHSWRVLILLGSSDHQDLVKQIRLDEPWNSEYNSQFHKKMPQNFHCPSRNQKELNEGLTPHRMIVGPDTISDGSGCTKIVDAYAGTSNTILFVESSISVPWMKPEDLPQSALVHGVVDAKPRRGKSVPLAIGSPHRNGAYLAMMDSSIPFLPDTTSPEILYEMSKVRDRTALMGIPSEKTEREHKKRIKEKYESFVSTLKQENTSRP